MKIAEMRGTEDAQLASEIESLKRELLTQRCRLALGEDIKPSEVKRLRREIARCKTVVREREMAAGAESGTRSED